MLGLQLFPFCLHERTDDVVNVVLGLAQRDVLEKSPRFAMLDGRAGGEFDEGAEAFKLEDFLVGEGLEVATAIRVRRAFFEVEVFDEEVAVDLVRDPFFRVRDAELGRAALRVLLEEEVASAEG
jgi:hypothetical protein